ncbi:helix-turn-helix domain-containing protein [Kordia zhangzhouensis]|uniref:helix-turn-helix domain-containing protein n=1 Tax=Kordia zhangzhouensis TaxID=1620405 RepID=UPI0006293569|nr:helix-turn-helix transcriptional regulator [Kordia zhangzhouensis]
MLRVKEVAKSKNISLEQLANILQINRVTLSRTINGNPTVETLTKIANALDVEISELFSSSKGNAKLHGYVEYKNEVYRIHSKKDLENLLDIVNTSSN